MFSDRKECFQTTYLIQGSKILNPGTCKGMEVCYQLDCWQISQGQRGYYYTQWDKEYDPQDGCQKAATPLDMLGFEILEELNLSGYLWTGQSYAAVLTLQAPWEYFPEGNSQKDEASGD